MPDTQALPSLSLIAPSQGNKYSKNLFDFLIIKPVYAENASVFRDHEGILWLGIKEDDWFTGVRLMDVLCNGKKTTTGAYSLSHLGNLEAMQGFWPRYIQHGRCAIDEAHQISFTDDKTRWRVQGEVRDGQHSQRRVPYQITLTRHRWMTQATQINQGHL